MIKYFTFDKVGTTPSGALRRRIMLNSKTGAARRRKYVKKTKPVLICGYENSGKSRQLNKFRTRAGELWPKRKLIEIDCNAPLTYWGRAELGEASNTQKRVDELIAVKSAVFIIEDADKCTGRKLQLLNRLCKSNVFVMTCKGPNLLAPALRAVVTAREPEILELTTMTSFDATRAAGWLMCVIFALLGFTELAIAMGGMNLLSNGRGASKNV